MPSTTCFLCGFAILEGHQVRAGKYGICPTLLSSVEVDDNVDKYVAVYKKAPSDDM